MFFLISWMIWKERNDRTFGRQATPALQLVHKIVEEANDWIGAGYRHLLSPIGGWMILTTVSVFV
jgi:hypothetical protein